MLGREYLDGSLSIDPDGPAVGWVSETFNPELYVRKVEQLWADPTDNPGLTTADHHAFALLFAPSDEQWARHYAFALRGLGYLRAEQRRLLGNAGIGRSDVVVGDPSPRYYPDCIPLWIAHLLGRIRVAEKLTSNRFIKLLRIISVYWHARRVNPPWGIEAGVFRQGALCEWIGISRTSKGVVSLLISVLEKYRLLRCVSHAQRYGKEDARPSVYAVAQGLLARPSAMILLPARGIGTHGRSADAGATEEHEPYARRRPVNKIDAILRLAPPAAERMEKFLEPREDMTGIRPWARRRKDAWSVGPSRASELPEPWPGAQSLLRAEERLLMSRWSDLCPALLERSPSCSASDPLLAPAAADWDAQVAGWRRTVCGRLVLRGVSLSPERLAPRRERLGLRWLWLTGIETRVAAMLSRDQRLAEFCSDTWWGTVCLGEARTLTRAELLEVWLPALLCGSRPEQLNGVAAAMTPARSPAEAERIHDWLGSSFPDLWRWRQRVGRAGGAVVYAGRRHLLPNGYPLALDLYQARAAAAHVCEAVTALVMAKLVADLECHQTAPVGEWEGAIAVHGKIPAEVEALALSAITWVGSVLGLEPPDGLVPHVERLESPAAVGRWWQWRDALRGLRSAQGLLRLVPPALRGYTPARRTDFDSGEYGPCGMIDETDEPR